MTDVTFAAVRMPHCRLRQSDVRVVVLTVPPNVEALQIRCVPAGNLTVSVPLDRLERVDFGGGKRNCCLRRLSSLFWRRWHRDAVGPSTTNGDEVSSFTLVTPYSAIDVSWPALTNAMS